MDRQGRHNHLRCPCYDVRGEFQKLVEVGDTGLVIYRHCHTPQTKYVRKKTEEQTIDHNIFIIHNTQNADIKLADKIISLDMCGISCPRCAQIIKNVKRMVEIVPKIKSYSVMGTCDSCRKKLTKCMKCDEVVKRFVMSRNEFSKTKKDHKGNDIKRRVISSHSSISSMKSFLPNVILDRALSKGKKRRFCDVDNLRIHNISTISPQEPVIKDAFEVQATTYRGPRTSDTQENSIPLHSHLARNKKKAIFIDSLSSNATETARFYSRSQDDITYHDRKSSADDEALDSSGKQNEGKCDFKTDNILNGSDFNSKLRFNQEYQHKFSRNDIDPMKSNLKKSNFAKSAPVLYSNNIPSVISSTIDTNTLHSDFRYYFPKKLNMKIEKPITSVSSSELIKITQNMLQDLTRQQEGRDVQKLEKAKTTRKLNAQKLAKNTEHMTAEEELGREPISITEDSKTNNMFDGSKEQIKSNISENKIISKQSKNKKDISTSENKEQKDQQEQFLDDTKLRRKMTDTLFNLEKGSGSRIKKGENYDNNIKKGDPATTGREKGKHVGEDDETITAIKGNKRKAKEDTVMSNKNQKDKESNKTEEQNGEKVAKNVKKCGGIENTKVPRSAKDKQNIGKKLEVANIITNDTIHKTTKASDDKSVLIKSNKKQLRNVDEAVADEFQELLAGEIKQQKLDQKQKKNQVAENKKYDNVTLRRSSLPKKALRKPLTVKDAPLSSPAQKFTANPIQKDLSFGKIKMTDFSGYDLLQNFVKINQRDHTKALMKPGDDIKIKKILALHKQHQNNISCILCTDSDLQINIESILNKGDIDKIANMIIGEKIYKFKIPIRDDHNLMDKQASDVKIIDEEICKLDKNGKIHAVHSEKVDLEVQGATNGIKIVSNKIIYFFPLLFTVIIYLD